MQLNDTTVFQISGKTDNNAIPVAQISHDDFINTFTEEVIQYALSGTSCFIAALGPHGCGKTDTLFSRGNFLETLLARLLVKTKKNYQVAISLFELQDKIIIDHLAPESNYQSHFKQPNILSCKIASRRDYMLLANHMRNVSQNFEDQIPVQNKANGFARILCYNYETKVLSNIMIADIMGDDDNYKQVLSQLSNCLYSSQQTFIDINQQSPLLQFIVPITKISRCYFVSFNENDTELQNFIQNIKDFKSKNITIRLEIKDLLTIGIDDVECEQIDISSLISSQSKSGGQTMSPEVALGQSNNTIKSSITDLYQTDRSAAKQSQLKQSQNELSKSDLNHLVQNDQTYSELPKQQSNIASTSSNMYSSYKKVSIQKQQPQQTESMLRSQKISITRIPERKVLQDDEEIEPNKNNELEIALKKLKKAESVRNDLEQKLRLIESSAAEAKVRSELTRINNKLRLNIVKQLERGGLQHQDKLLESLSNQICSQIAQNTDLVLQKCQAVQLPGVRQKLNEFREQQHNLILKQRDMNALMQAQRDLIIDCIQNEKIRSDADVVQKNMQQLQQQIDKIDNSINELNISLDEQERQLQFRRNQVLNSRRTLESFQNDLSEIQAVSMQLGQLPPNIEQFTSRLTALMTHFNKIAQRQILTTQEVQIRNLCSKLLDLCGQEQQWTRGDEIFSQLRDSVHEQEQQIELILNGMLTTLDVKKE